MEVGIFLCSETDIQQLYARLSSPKTYKQAFFYTETEYLYSLASIFFMLHFTVVQCISNLTANFVAKQFLYVCLNKN